MFRNVIVHSMSSPAKKTLSLKSTNTRMLELTVAIALRTALLALSLCREPFGVHQSRRFGMHSHGRMIEVAEWGEDDGLLSLSAPQPMRIESQVCHT